MMRSCAAQNFSHNRTKPERSGIWGRQRWSTHAHSSWSTRAQTCWCHSVVTCASLPFMSQKPQALPWANLNTHMTQKQRTEALKCSGYIVVTGFAPLKWFAFRHISIEHTCIFRNRFINRIASFKQTIKQLQRQWDLVRYHVTVSFIVTSAVHPLVTYMLISENS